MQAESAKPNRERKLKFFPYGDDSVPILFSESIKHVDAAHVTNQDNVQLRHDALDLLLEGKINSAHLGRKNVPTTGPRRIINDCDLYFRGGRVYVAAEQGLLLAADYLTLIGVPDTQPVRFEGEMPAWAKALVALQHRRIVDKSFDPRMESMEDSQFIPVEEGWIVTILEVIPVLQESGDIFLWAYGMPDDPAWKGMFPYHHTVPLESDEEELPIWQNSPPSQPDSIERAEEDDTQSVMMPPKSTEKTPYEKCLMYMEEKAKKAPAALPPLPKWAQYYTREANLAANPHWAVYYSSQQEVAVSAATPQVQAEEPAHAGEESDASMDISSNSSRSASPEPHHISKEEEADSAQVPHAQEEPTHVGEESDVSMDISSGSSRSASPDMTPIEVEDDPLPID